MTVFITKTKAGVIKKVEYIGGSKKLAERQAKELGYKGVVSERPRKILAEEIDKKKKITYAEKYPEYRAKGESVEEWRVRTGRVSDIVLVTDPKTHKKIEIPVVKTDKDRYLYKDKEGKIKEISILSGKYAKQRTFAEIGKAYIGKPAKLVALSVGSVPVDKYSEYKVAEEYSKIQRKEKSVWVSPKGETIIAPDTAPEGMKEETAKLKGYTKLDPKDIVKKESELYVKPTKIEKIAKTTPAEVVSAIKGAIEIGKPKEITKLPEDEYIGYTALEIREKEIEPIIKKIRYEKTPEYAIEIGKQALREMKKKGTLEEIKGIVASGVRPWSVEVAGMQIAEKAGYVKKGTAGKLLQQRLGEEIIKTKQEGVTIQGFIRRLAEAPTSVIGTPLTMVGVGTALTGVRGALATQPVKIKYLFDLTMAGVGGWWAGTRAGEMIIAEREKDRPKLISLGLQTMSEVGGVIIGARLVKASSPEGKPMILRPRGVVKSEVKTVELTSKGKTIGELNRGKLNIDMVTKEGKTVSVEGTFRGTTKEGVTKAYINIPKQVVEGINIKSQKILLKSQELETIISYGKRAVIERPIREPIVAEDVKIGEIVKPAKIVYTPYVEKGVFLERKLTFEEQVGLAKLKTGLAKQTKSMDDSYTDIIKTFKQYKITPREDIIGFREAGIIERVIGKKVVKRQALGETTEGIKYGIKEVRTKFEIPTLEKVYFDISRGIRKVVDIPKLKKPKPVKKVVEKPKEPITVDKMYKDTISNVNEQSRQLLRPKPKEKPVVEPRTEMNRIIREIEKIRVKAVEMPLKRRVDVLPKRKIYPTTILEDISKSMEKNMAQVLGITKIQKIPVKPKEVLVQPKAITPIVERDYIQIQDELVDISTVLQPVIEPLPRPPTPRPERIDVGLPIIPVGVPIGVGLGVAMDTHYKTITKHIKHKIPTIEEILRM